MRLYIGEKVSDRSLLRCGEEHGAGRRGLASLRTPHPAGQLPGGPLAGRERPRAAGTGGNHAAPL